MLPAEPSASGAGPAASRDSATGTATAKTCTVASGDTLWGICRRYYGDGSLAWRLAAANGIANANLIRPGQVLTIPPLAQLPAAAARPASAQVAAATEVREVEEESGTARLVPWVPENTVKLSLIHIGRRRGYTLGGMLAHTAHAIQARARGRKTAWYPGPRKGARVKENTSMPAAASQTSHSRPRLVARNR